MPLTKLQFQPGINQEVTAYSNEGGWRDCDKIRFRFGYPEKMGGWSKLTSSTYLGSARALHNWIALDGSNFLGIGTHFKYYIEEGGRLNDITPTRLTTSAGDITFSASNGSTTITVTDSDHGAEQFDFVTFSGAASLGGTITATILNIEYQIQKIVSSSQYEITSSVAANSSDSGNGGGSTVGAYQVNVGTDTPVGGTGWGAGTWGGQTNGALTTQLAEALDASETGVDVDDETGITTTGDVIKVDDELMLVTSTTDDNTLTVTRGYAGSGAASNVQPTGSTGIATTHADNTLVTLVKGNTDSSDDFSGWGDAAAGGLTTTNNIRLWSHDNFGEDLLINARDSNIFYWDKTEATSTRAIELSAATTGVGTGPKRAIPQKSKQIIVSDKEKHVIAFGTDNISAASTSTTSAGDLTFSASSSSRIITVTDTSHGAQVGDFVTISGATSLGGTVTADILNRRYEIKTVLNANSYTIEALAIANASDSGNGGSSTIGLYQISAITGDNIQDPLLIRFSSRGSATDWFPTEENTAGDLLLGSGSEFVQAVETKREILIWTDTSLFSMTFVGGQFVFSLQQLSSNTTIISPNSAVASEDVVFWMGKDAFYVYDGATRQIPCSVKDKVFLDFNSELSDKVFGGINSEYAEIIWFYPSANATDNDRYVTYNYQQQIWYFGTLSRTAWLDRGSRPLPIATGGQYIYNHEVGYDDDGSAMNSFIESSPIDIGDGENFTFINKIIPDVSFVGSTNLSSPQATFTIKSRNFPGEDFGNTSSGVTTRSQETPVELFTKELNVRSRGRSFALRIDSNAVGSKWKLGSPRINVRQDGRR
jgi:hypothetical protein